MYVRVTPTPARRYVSARPRAGDLWQADHIVPVSEVWAPARACPRGPPNAPSPSMTQCLVWHRRRPWPCPSN